MSISIRDLQQMSSAKIAALKGTTAVKAGGKVVALLTPMRTEPLSQEELAELDATLGEAVRLRKLRKSDTEEEAFLRSLGVDLTEWTEDEIEKLQREAREMRAQSPR